MRKGIVRLLGVFTINQVISILIANLALLGSGALFFYKSWLDFIRPDWFYIFRIYENGMLNYKEKKIFLPISGTKDVYEFNKIEYDKTGVQPFIDEKGVYTWNFEVGKAKPLTFNNQDNIDGSLLSQATKTRLDKIWFNADDISEFFKTYGWVILAVIMLCFLGYLITRDQKTTALILNITRR